MLKSVFSSYSFCINAARGFEDVVASFAMIRSLHASTKKKK
jgi:hypothetical protein